MIRRIFIWLLCLLTVFSVCSISVFAQEDEPATVTNGSYGIDSAMPYFGKEGMIENVQSAFVFETNSQTLLYEWNADTPQYPASLVKLMTALLVLENCQLSQSVTVTESALSEISSDAISLKLQAGEQFTVEQLLYALLVSSANDAAAVLAQHTSGSLGSFVDKMNLRAEELGCTGTHFENPHGLHHENQKTTARDVCRILMELLNHDIFREIFGTVKYTLPATSHSKERNLTTNNFLMCTDDVAIYHDSRVTGGRSGMTTDNFRCIASLSQSQDMEVICIVMGCASEVADNGYSIEVYGGFPETITLLDKVYSNQRVTRLICAGQIIQQLPVAGGECDVFYTTDQTVSAVLPADCGLDQLSYRYEYAPGSSEAPISAGQNLAQLQVWHGERCVAQVDVFAANDVAVAAPVAGEYIKTANPVVIVILVIVVLLLMAAGSVFVVLIRGRTRKNKTRKKIKRR